MLECVKMSGNGNDFIIIDNMTLAFDTKSLSLLARQLCRRRESVGADGILAAEPSSVCEFKMRLFNRDGSEGEMCGNGARCMAAYAFDRGLAGRSMSFETLGGAVRASVGGRGVAVDMAPVDLSGVVMDASASAGGFSFRYTFVNAGVPHAVIFEEAKRSDGEYRRLGRAVRNMRELFPAGANVDFAVPRGGTEDALDVTTYERGVEDLTLSCGTGSVASAIAGMLLGVTGSAVEVYNPGGLNKVSLRFASAGIVLPTLEGRVSFVADISALEGAFK